MKLTAKDRRALEKIAADKQLEFIRMTDVQKRDYLLPHEQGAMETDMEFYLDCMNGLMLKDRHTDMEIRDGLILYRGVYLRCKK